MLKVKQLLKEFSNVRVLVIGDLMLDSYFYGNVNRISPEAPVPVVNITEKKSVVGGAGNVAVNIAGLGAKPFLVGLVGDDADGELLIETIEKSGVPAENLLKIADRRTTVKTRVVAHQQHIVRLDQENKNKITRVQEEQVWQIVEPLLDEVKIAVISDYAKGLLTENILSLIIAKCENSGIFLLVDPKGKNYSIYSRAAMLTPNRREAAEACNLNEDLPDLVGVAGAQLMFENKLEALLITEGENGMTLFQKNKESKHFSAFSREVYDVTGAGDTVISTLAVALGAGADLETAAEIANIAAGTVIEHFGTTAIKLSDLAERIKVGAEV